MHDARELIEAGDSARHQLARRRFRLDTDALDTARVRRAEALHTVADLRARLKAAARTRTAPTPAEREHARALRERVQQAQQAAHDAERALSALLHTIPNLPAGEVPEGDSDQDALEVRRGGPPPAPAAPEHHHAEVGEKLGILDAARAARLSGARFSAARGAGARLERALADFFLDLHTREHGYTEYAVPYLVNRATMTATGQLPKFAEDLFATRVGERELFLIPTAEVPLTNLAAGEVLDAGELPLAFTARTPCFRAEAGSYGRDTRGILRLHQFEKVELVRICAAEQAPEQLQLMLGHAEECLRRLELSHRTVLLPAGDLGFAARMTYDIEVWLPGSNAFREISSVSDCGTFQARRAGIRVRTPGGGRTYAATLNGSALPIGRTLAALLEQGHQSDGSVLLPKALHPYTGFTRILPGGTTA
ncbi:serine--tRNA ligase [Streptomyces sp. CC224B]|uniref:serine--tRNA ligase n=1 Tax=Streptomyces sp. CC224B TaxID=3044571 RepID=UPI0024A82F67|nr:serine--tRNA ligase [Streptomyces sp. CC224B]